ncbi:MAG TPA: cyclase family protein, partial [Acidimicrobiia bacterium]|nr:cyclase family protein [Acidimicrobiia bacterium]
MLPPEVKELAAEVRNWGRWGTDDEIGTLNLITDDVVRAAAAEIRVGRRLALGLALNERGPQTGVIPGRDNPTHEMIMVDTPLTGDPSDFTTSDDKVVLALQAATHWDALAHVSYEGTLYNGVPS